MFVTRCNLYMHTMVCKKRGKNVRAIIAYCTKYSLRKMQLRQQPMLIQTLNWNKIKVKIKYKNTNPNWYTYCWFYFIATVDLLLPLQQNPVKNRIMMCVFMVTQTKILTKIKIFMPNEKKKQNHLWWFCWRLLNHVLKSTHDDGSFIYSSQAVIC